MKLMDAFAVLPGAATSTPLGSLPADDAYAASLRNDALVQSARVHYLTVSIEGVQIFYREAGPKDAPVVLLLHGFPTSSHMFRDLIPALADRYRVIAPDYPGFGFSDFPDPQRFRYSFESFAHLMERFTHALGLGRYAIYLHDYGAPVGLRLALRAPARVSALIVQNGNAYEAGLGGGWDPLKAYWREPTLENRAKVRNWLAVGGVREQYTAGLRPEQLELVSPDNWTLDWQRLSWPGNIDMQLGLFGDYQNNVALYPKFQRFFRECRPPTLIVWGERDPFFTVAGAQAYLRDLPDAALHLLDGGHFALETHGPAIAALMRDFLHRHLGKRT
jgi:pimeloyl-ACP methyl ester carboxylesterase